MKILNKTAPAAYKIVEKIEAGIALIGPEVKAIKEGNADLSGAYVKLLNGEAFLVNAKIFAYKYATDQKLDETRSRKVLLHKKQIVSLKHKLDQGNMTIVPLSLYLKHTIIKLEIALARGKKQYEKREDLKRKTLEREAEEAIKRKI